MLEFTHCRSWAQMCKYVQSISVFRISHAINCTHATWNLNKAVCRGVAESFIVHAVYAVHMIYLHFVQWTPLHHAELACAPDKFHIGYTIKRLWRVVRVVQLTKLMTSLKWKNILVSLCAQRMNPNPSLSAAITPYGEERGWKTTTNFISEMKCVRLLLRRRSGVWHVSRFFC